ncbi:acetyl/propionyl/methylcrotonyl-CoA carboxylase subunit alpha [Achromobacter sp. Marseille-Q0513]|uniref:acetyl/propionyl/methylcrotonyl-CoA carboxylase subunit alpha n=1 Tax=Achromobacter sp. Marseille-Q0513 TaxID=2829161 RepID=UPI001B944338|nr:acetyl/propionyl/methylcrotonyl-CoA carboxylase subunit alpha [Achromobacter sp. Marseille-Q0513]MBR8656212.1 acetyl/propionyl/methylcrotonyl-CoA carboxylase subunit alpha [Achromobacter sp. Marseille-Q0513]
MFDTLLIANRGEIACRVAATARRLGIRTVAVYSDADANARHVAACDVAVHIGGPEPRASYLRADAILQAARDTGAQAIHPGYGFLSENEAFAQAATDAGIAFVGPPASAIAAMGSKSAAKSLMEKAGVPLVPGYHGDNQDPQFLKTQADAIGYPVLIKASAGGGGKGMRVVESSGAFLDALASCQREAASSFGDDRVLIERYLQKPRHIEIQVFADTQGNCVYLFERDCSVQRRHQKVIEEAPAPGMTEERRRAMGEAAVAAARAVGYVGAGTVEFIAEPDGRFYFMEMNTRLQVEHPVTEMITGHDLVEWQLRVAAGQPLPARQEDLRIEGHAIEARIYAENPEKGFLPSIGTLAYLGLPAHTAFANGDIRVDGGVRMGDTITPFYDPMIAKLIVRGADRDQARARMLQALAQTQAVGVQTNVAFLSRLMRDSAFAAADLDTGLIERQRETLLPAPQPAGADALALASAAVLARQGLAQPGATTQASADPWAARDGWRLGGQYRRELQWVDNGETRRVAIARHGKDWTLDAGDGPQPFLWRAQANAGGAFGLRVTLGGHESAGTVALHADRAYVFTDAGSHALELYDPLAHSQDTQGEHGGGLTAPMPGKIISIAVKAGDTVEKGQPLLVMEAMKMEHTISAPADGKVAEVFYAIGDQVTEGAELVAIE